MQKVTLSKTAKHHGQLYYLCSILPASTCCEESDTVTDVFTAVKV